MKRILLSAVLLGAMHFTLAQPGTMDASFAENAVIRNINFLEGPSEATTHVITDDQDRIWIAGYTLVDDDYQLILVRLTADGAYDTDFNDDGYAVINIAANNVEQVGGMAIQNGKLLIAGHKAANGVTNQFVLRFNADGTLDTGFGALGMADLPFNAVVSDMVLDGTGHIYLAGSANGNITVTKLLPGGAPDVSFSGDGFRTAAFASTDLSASIELDEAGNIYVIGSGVSNAINRAQVTSFLPNGNSNMDFSFTGRKAFTWPNDVNFVVLDGLLTEDGTRFYIAGSTIDGQMNAAMMAVTLAGEVDTDFGNSGRIQLDASLGGDEIFTKILEGEDGIYATLNLQELPVGINGAMAYINHNGGLHSDFGNGGWSDFNIVQSGDDQALNMTFQSDGNIIMIGIASGEGDQFAGYAARIFTSADVSSAGYLSLKEAGIFPNPAINEITVAVGDLSPSGEVFQIFDATGQLVHVGRLQYANQKIEVENFSPGLYHIVIGEHAHARFVKMN